MVKRIVQLLSEAFRQWNIDRSPRLAAALAFYTILSLSPLLLISTAIAGFFFGEDAARGEIVHQLRGLIGQAGAEVVQTALEKAHRPRAGIIATTLGIVTLLLGASAVFGELQDALNKVWKVPEKPPQSWSQVLRDRFFSFAMVLVMGFILLVSLIVSAILSAVGIFIESTLLNFGFTLKLFNVLLSFSIVTSLFAAMFRFIPDIRTGWREILIGSLITAFLFTVGKHLIVLYLERAGIETPFGAAGSLVVFVVWIYYSGLIFFFGAELTQILAHTRDHTRPPSATLASRP
jgi:membrane protein